MRTALRFFSIVSTTIALAACFDAPVGVDSSTNGITSAISNAVSISNSELLGDKLFNDINLSVNRNQSCATCHEPSEGFASAIPGVPQVGSAIQGSVAGKFGARKPPTAAYATLTPTFTNKNGASGGLFWDGRATGAVLGTPAADQALGPFLNPVEQALPDAACLVYRVRTSSYVALYVGAWNDDIVDIAFPSNVEAVCSTPVNAAGEFVTLSTVDRERTTIAYHNIAKSIADYEGTFNRFSSAADAGTLTALEAEGLKLFSTKAKCQQCHTNKDVGAVFTDFRFHNLGVPRNPDNVSFNYTTGAFDPGLGGVTGSSAHLGKFRTPTTRNVGVGVNRTFMHNGVLKSLKQVVDFYNTRDVLRRCTAQEIGTLHPSQYGSYDPDGTGPLTAAGCWPAPEYAQNMDTKQMGALGLTEAQVNAIVAYLKAMSDR
jgi:cytochrome c peroxidase